MSIDSSSFVPWSLVTSLLLLTICVILGVQSSRDVRRNMRQLLATRRLYKDIDFASLHSPTNQKDLPALLQLPRHIVIVPFYNEAAKCAETVTSIINAVTKSRQEKVEYFLRQRVFESTVEQAKYRQELLHDPHIDCVRVILVNDRSTDQTLTILQALVQEEETRCQADNCPVWLRVITSTTRPQGEKWLGKCWACTNGWRYYQEQVKTQEKFESEYVIFSDADCNVLDLTFERSIHSARLLESDLCWFIVCPKHYSFPTPTTLLQKLTASFTVDNVFLPFIYLSLIEYVSVFDIADSQKKDCLTLGGYVVFPVKSYESYGTHANPFIRQHICEDLQFGKLVKHQQGRISELEEKHPKEKRNKLRVIDGTPLILTYFYKDTQEIWEGLGKNAFSSIGYSFFILFLQCLKTVLLSIVPTGLFLYHVFILYFYAFSSYPFFAPLIPTTDLLLHLVAVVLCIVILAINFPLLRLLSEEFNITGGKWYMEPFVGIFFIILRVHAAIKFVTKNTTWKGRKQD